MSQTSGPGFEARKARCKRAVWGDSGAMAELSVWVREVAERAAVGDNLAKRELEELAYAVAYDVVEGRLRQSFPRLRGRHSVSSALHVAYLRLGNTAGLFREPATFAADLSSFCRRLCYMAHYALLDFVNRQRVRDRHHPRPREAVVAADGGRPGSLLDTAPAGGSWDPVRMAQWAEVRELVERLPQPARDVFIRHFYLGLSQREIADRTGLHPRQVSRLWSEAVAALGDVLEPNR
jgi:RNA polymerase sigma factor (sigma-70 family)